MRHEEPFEEDALPDEDEEGEGSRAGGFVAGLALGALLGVGAALFLNSSRGRRLSRGSAASSTTSGTRPGRNSPAGAGGSGTTPAGWPGRRRTGWRTSSTRPESAGQSLSLSFFPSISFSRAAPCFLYSGSIASPMGSSATCCSSVLASLYWSISTRISA